MSFDGSRGRPWSTLEAVIAANKIESLDWISKPPADGTRLVLKNTGAPVKAGDTLMLRTGYHGRIAISGYYNTADIVVMADSGQAPAAAGLSLRSSSHWIIKGLAISPSFINPYQNTTLIDVASHSWNGPVRECVIENCSGYSVPYTDAWDMAEWDTLSCNAVNLSGKRLTIRNCYFKNVNFGISVSDDSCLVEGNTIENFAGDGLRGLGDYDTFVGNTVKNCYAVNANHDDGFQSWSVGAGGVGTGVVKGIVLRGNLIINYVNESQPFRGTLQGIGCFDGMFEDWVIENNVIITDHWHGITLMGAINCRVVNNTVVDRNSVSPGPPWIRITAHKDSTPPEGCIVRNNLTNSLACDDIGVTLDHNITFSMSRVDSFFLNYPAFDLRLKPNCAAVDSGSSLLAPLTDFLGITRPQGLRVDVGAYEYGPGDAVDVWSPLMASGVSEIYPNPFNSVMTIFAPKADRVRIFNVQGKKVGELGVMGIGKAVWNSGKTPPGVYMAEITFGAKREMRRVTLLR